MKYRELLSLYRSGQLDENQRKQVEADIEKQDAISEYLCEEGEVPSLEELGLPTEETGSDDGARFTAAIQKSIRRAFVKMGLIVGASVLAITLCAIFVLPRLVDHFYYDPTDIVGQNPNHEQLTTNRMSLDLAVFSELFLPCRYRGAVNAIPTGYGTYDITIPQSISADGRFNTLTGHLVRGKLTLYDTNPLQTPASNAFQLDDELTGLSSFSYVDGETGLPIPMEDQKASAFQFLADRADNGYLIGYVSLNEIMDYETFSSWYKTLSISDHFPWCGIYAENRIGQFITANIGMNPSSSGVCLDWDREQYPNLSTLDNTTSSSDRSSDPAWLTTHFISLMHYLKDHPELVSIFGPVNTNPDPDQIINYVKAHGLQVYGFAVTATRDELLTLQDEPMVRYISTQPY